MAKLKCRCGHKFAETLAVLQQQGVSRLKCPACGQVSTIPAGGNATEPVSNQTESVGVSSSPDVGDFFSMLSNESTPIPLTVTATPEAEPLEMPTTRPEAPSGPSWSDRAKAMLTKQIAVPAWLMMAIGVGVLFLAGISLRGAAPIGREGHEDDKVIGLDPETKILAGFYIGAIKSHVQLNADDPKSIQWVQFQLLTEEDISGIIPHQHWVVWYRALNTHNALELFRESVEFQVIKDKDGKQIANFTQIEKTQRIPVKR